MRITHIPRHHRTQPTRTTSHQHPPGKHQPTPTTGPTTAAGPAPTTGPAAAGHGGTGQPGRPQPPTPNRHLRLTTADRGCDRSGTIGVDKHDAARVLRL